ncbi:MAG TPA: electron transfer flavoprotein subunit alpha/FixB family protein [Desulfomonilaceae bacterium]|nr:electron transfer flavoprotein subunit alpha/FixB family protein [Desulfomonilaceae bacterium]
MKNVFVLAEHRKQHLRDTTWEALAAGRKAAAELGADLTCILLGSNTDGMAEILSKECGKVLVADDPGFETFNSEAFMKALPAILKDRGPFLLVMGNSNSVLDLAPGLSVVLDAALATDCFGLEVVDGKVTATRQMYSYKVNTTVSFKNADRIVLTLRAGAFPYTLSGAESGAREKVASPLGDGVLRKRFVGFVEAEQGDVDVASADIIVSIGRGIGDEPDMDVFQSLADSMGGVLACSRPIVDKNFLPKYHQVGTSGVEVKPKVYLALGISGAFQHVGGIKGSPLIVAVNKDARAPIFRVAQYGIVADVYDVVPALEEKIKELKG